MTMPITSFMSGTVVSSAWLNEVNHRLGEVYTPLSYGAVGDGVTDDTTAVMACFAACPAYGTIDLMGKNYKITQPMALANTYVTLQNGKFTLANDSLQFFYVVTARDYCKFRNIKFQGTGVTGTAGTPKYQGGIFSGNIDYPSPMNVASANHVRVENCTFDNLTTGIFIGDSSVSVAPKGWIVSDNTFINMVGYPGQSEGYGVLFSPANDGVIKNNYFKDTRRHAIYVASEGSNNVIDGNIIDGCDNIAIQSNTNNGAYPIADGNKYINNEIRGLTRSIAYGYRSSIGIGLYGKFTRTIVANNRIYGALDTGIEASGSIAGAAYASDLMIQDNMILMDATATDCGIRINDVQGFQARGNTVKINGAIYGFAIDLAVSPNTYTHEVSGNTIETSNTGAFAFRVNSAVARTIRIYRNTLHGFQDNYTQQIFATITAGSLYTDLNHRVGVVATDADFSVNIDGYIANTDASNILHTGTLTANRTVTLVERSEDLGSGRDGEITVTRTGSGAFTLNIKSTTGGTLKGLATGQWAKFKRRADTGVWVLVSFGSL